MAIFIFLLCCLTAQAEQFELSLQNAEQQTLQTSDRLKAATLDVDVVTEQEGAGFAAILPRLSLNASYTYLSTLPSLSVGPGSPNITFGDHNNYSVGPALNYTLWDTLSSLKSYQALSKLKESRQQDRIGTELQLLFSVRAAYVRVQLALEELRLVNGSLDLAYAQNKDVSNRFHAGAATKLDTVLSSRQVLGFKLQFQQKQADLSAALKDLLALIGNKDLKNISQPGPPGVEHVSLVLQLDPLATTLSQLGRLEISAPTHQQPQIRSLQLLAESSERLASAQTAKLFPTIQLFASTTLAYPNGPVLNQINQNTIGLTLSLPLYLGDPTWHLAASKRLEAESAKHRAAQLKTDINRDFSKAREMLDSLREQQKLAAQDVSQSAEAARLYYSSYKAGKANLTDVETANNQALQSKVGAARIDAQILNQMIALMALSGEKIHESF